MKLLHTIPVGSEPYPVDAISQNLVLVSTRGLQSAQPVNVQHGNTLHPVNLQHKPRSTTLHATENLALVGGADRAQTTVIDTNRLQTKIIVGTGNTGPPGNRDFGGDLACGHPAWGPNNTILHLDRIDRRIELYDLGGGNRLASVDLKTSPHHVTPADGGYLALCEGNPGSRINPSVLKFHIKNSSIMVAAHEPLSILTADESKTGGHHLTYDAMRDRIYVGTNEGRMFTLHGTTLQCLKVVDTGPGCGHVTICGQGLAVATNHTGVSMTVIDLDSGQVTGKVVVSKLAKNNKRTQGHTSKWLTKSDRLVTTAAQDGLVLEIDPARCKITRTVQVPGAYLIQGCFVEG